MLRFPGSSLPRAADRSRILPTHTHHRMTFLLTEARFLPRPRGILSRPVPGAVPHPRPCHAGQADDRRTRTRATFAPGLLRGSGGREAVLLRAQSVNGLGVLDAAFPLPLARPGTSRGCSCPASTLTMQVARLREPRPRTPGPKCWRCCGHFNLKSPVKRRDSPALSDPGVLGRQPGGDSNGPGPRCGWSRIVKEVKIQGVSVSVCSLVR